MTTSRLTATPGAGLRLDGRVVTPDDADYDALRTVVRGDVDARPALIARVSGPEDVARVIAYARDAGLELAVRSGGHSGAGHGATDGGVVLDVRELRELEIDVEARTVWAGSGISAGEVTAAVGEHGLAIGFGDTGSVGIAGITLGGGIGYLVRRHGMTIDNLLAADVVTADGMLRRVDADNEPELFWAIRGGGGNFGVATRFQYRLHPLPEVYGGMLVLPATPETVAGFIAAAESAPEEVSTIANVMNCPPMPFVPDDVVGSPIILGFICHAGGGEAAERGVAPFRALAEPIADMLAPMPYAGMFPAEEAGEYRPKATTRTMFVDRIGLDEARAIIERIASSDAPMRAVQLRVLGGAMARVPADATAFAHRAARIMAIIVSLWEDERDFPARRAWVEELAGHLDQGVPGGYVNFLEDDGPGGVRAAYPEATLARLAAVKARYDPENLFRRNHNVPPVR